MSELAHTPAHTTALSGLGVELPERFAVRGVLGKGGMGVVLEAHDQVLGRDVAIKVLPETRWADPDTRQRFVREARAAAMLRDPSIVTVHELSPDGHFIVMELIRGESLRDRLTRLGKLPPAEVRQVGLSLCRALGVAHAAGIVHRDVKPSNVLFDEAGRVRLADFGVASFLDSDLTVSGVAVGSPAYMAPEQLRGAPITVRADLYAVGATLFEAATGKRLHGEAGTCRDPRREVMTATGDRVLAAAIEAAVAERPEDRMADVAILRAALTTRTESRSPLRLAGHLVVAGLLALGAARLGTDLRGSTQLLGGATPRTHATIALLPFQVAVADPSFGFTGRGIPHVIARELSRAPGIEVISAERVTDQFNSTSTATGDRWLGAAVELGADLVIGGTLSGDARSLALEVTLRRPDGSVVSVIEHTTSTDGLPIALRLATRRVAAASLGGWPSYVASASMRFDAERELELGIAEMQADAFGNSLERFQTAIALEPRFPEAHYYRALVTWWQTGSPEAALPVIQEALGTDLRPEQRAFLTALIPVVDVRYPAAIDGFAPLADQHPRNVDILYGYFEALWHGGEPRRAIDVFRRIRALRPRFQLAVQHPLSYFVTRADEGGLSWTLEGLLDDPKNRIWAVRAAVARRDYAGAVALANQLSEGSAGPSSEYELTDLDIERVQIAAMSGDLVEAGRLASIDRRIQIPNAAWGLAEAAGDRGAADAAATASLTAARKASGFMRASLTFDLATLAAALDGPAHVAGLRRDLTELEPALVRSLPAEGLDLLLALKVGDLARSTAAETSVYPEVAALARGLAAQRRGDHASARVELERALDHASDGRFALFEHHALARSARATGDLSAVLGHCDEVIRPRAFRWSWAGLVGSCLLWSGEASERTDPARARALLERLVRLRDKAGASDALVRAASDRLQALPR